MLKVLFKGVREDKNIIYIDKIGFLVKIFKYLGYKCLKVSWGIDKVKGYMFLLIYFSRGNEC